MEGTTAAAPAATTTTAPAVEPAQTTTAAPEVSKTETPPAPKRHKLKVDGRDVEVDETELIESGKTAAQMRRAAAARFEEAKRLKEEAEALRKQMETDPEAALEKLLGGRFDELAEKRLIRKMQLEQMDPRERALLQAKQELEAERAKSKAAQEAEEKKQSEALQRQIAEQFDREFGEALKKQGMPRGPETIRRMAQLTKRSAELGLSLTADQIASEVKKDFMAEQGSVFGGLEGESLLAAIGPDLMKRIRQADIARVRAAKATAAVQPPKPAPTPAANEEGEPNPHLLSREAWRKKMGL